MQGGFTRPLRSEDLGGGGWPLGRGRVGGMLRRQGGAASKRPVTFLVLADCLLLPPSRSPDALGLFIIAIHSALHTLCNERRPTQHIVAQRAGNVAE